MSIVSPRGGAADSVTHAARRAPDGLGDDLERPRRRSSRVLREEGHDRIDHTPRSQLPHHKLIADGVAVELLRIIKASEIKDAKLRDEALRAAKSACLNSAEGAGRVTRPDKARAFAVARGEAVEAGAALEIAEAWRCPSRLPRATPVADRLVALLTGLIRR